jgi:ligand-binding sensor domain-containing protein/signal transduction histidine kinase
MLRSLFSCCVMVCVVISTAHALDPNKEISQYAHTSWRIQDGVFNGTPNAITQTSDGYIWIGTLAGLIRFDGVRFWPWLPPPGMQPLSTRVFALYGAPDRTLWIGTGAGLSHWVGPELINYTGALGHVNSILRDRNGAIWFTRSRTSDDAGPLCEISGAKLRCYGKADGIPFPYAGAVVEGEGSLWVGGASMLSRWSPTSATTYVPKGLRIAEGLTTVRLAATKDGRMWVGMERTGPGLGLQQLTRGVLKPFVVPGFDSSALEVTALFSDRENGLWVGTANEGIYRIHAKRADHYRSEDGLTSDSINGFFQDKEGNLWVATSKGIDNFRDVRVTSFSTKEGLSSNSVGSLLASHDGTIWIGNDGALDLLRNCKASSIRMQNGLPGRRVTSLLEDHTGTLWVGVDNGLFVYENGEFHAINGRDGGRTGGIVAMAEDVEGNVWAASIKDSRRLIRIRDRVIREEFGPAQIPPIAGLAADSKGGIWLGIVHGGLARYQNGHLERVPVKPEGASVTVYSISVDPDGSVWGATSRGLIRWWHGGLKVLNARNGLPCDHVYSFVRDRHNSLWLYAQCGLVVITDSELQRWWENPGTVVNRVAFDVSDGVQTALTSFRPNAVRSPDGRLWFANEIDVQMIDPDRLDRNTTPPPAHIEQIIADRKGYAPRDDLHLPALTRDVEIDYTALSFVMPQRVRFRYKLEGYDVAWHDVGTRRNAFYTNLSPGWYRFRVIACNNDGVWSEKEALSSFSVSAAYFQTKWFRILCVSFVVFLLWAAYQLRVRQIAARLSIRFDAQMAERTHLARELHDTLLQTIHGSKMVADDALDPSADPDRMRRAIERLSYWLGQAMLEGREALQSLRGTTTHSNDLAEALQRAAIEEYRVRGSMEIVFSVEGTATEMHPIVRDEIYRIGYEAIRNAYRHSCASRVEVQLRYAKNFHLRVHDNGVGIDRNILANGKEGHFGLQGMRERAARIGGRLSFSTSSYSGTKIELSAPGNIVFPAKRQTPVTLFTKIKHLFEKQEQSGSLDE